MTLADLIRRRKAFLALVNSDQWSEDEACRLFGLVPGSLNADGIFDMAAKDAEEIADAVVPMLNEAMRVLASIPAMAVLDKSEIIAFAESWYNDLRKQGNDSTKEFCNDRR